jgi:uncharacterized protein
MLTLSEKLIRMGVRKGVRDLLPPRPKMPHAIEDVVQGAFLPTHAGNVFVAQTLYPIDYKHGRVDISPTRILATIAEWTKDERLLQVDPSQLVFLDTETSGLAGGTGTFAFLVGIGRFEPDGFRVAQYFMRDPEEELAVLVALLEHLDNRMALVTFNGMSFDLPILSARYIINRHRIDLKSISHLDLLKLARRLWSDRLESRALKSLELAVLDARRTQEDVPGSQIPIMYREYLDTRDARPLKGVFYHNAMDVVSMAGLLNYITRMLEQPASFEFEYGLDIYAIGKLLEDLGQAREAAQLYARALEYDLSEEHHRRIAQRLSMSYKRQRYFEGAVPLWSESAMRGELYAHVELAKYFEHRQRDYDRALEWTRSALALLDARDANPDTRRAWQSDLDRRRVRLQSKLQAT